MLLNVESTSAAGEDAVDWDAVDWDALGWNAVGWDAVDADAADWDAVDVDAVDVDAVGWDAAARESAPPDAAVRDAGHPYVIDTLGHVVEIADMITMQAAERLIGIDLARREALAAARRHGRAVSEITERSVRLEIAAALRVTEYTAARMIAQAEALVHRYPQVLDSFAAARMTERHAELLVDALDCVEEQFRHSILSRGLELAESEPVGTFRRRLHDLVERVRATTLAERHEDALVGRRVVLEPAADGMAWISTLAPAVEALAIHRRLTAMATALSAQEGETRTLDQLRSDVFCDLLIDGETDLHPAEARGIRATVAVTVPVLSLLSAEGAADEPATVEGIGPIPIARARELCGSADGFLRILTHPETGMVLSVGRAHYAPPASLRKLTKWRADRCMAPGCGMPASRCQIDHTIAWEHGGATSLDNLAPLCQGHHTVKHHGGWRVRQVEGSGGALEWLSPTGRRYLVQPERRVPVFRPQTAHDAPF